jgi:hypothetical protein
VGGRAEARYSTVDRGRAAVGLVEAGNGRFAIHADGFARESEDLRIPGFARSARQRAIDATVDPGRPQPSGLLPNTFSRAAGGALGASLTGERGYLGASLGSLRSAYGTPADVDARIDLRRDTARPRRRGARAARDLPLGAAARQPHRLRAQRIGPPHPRDRDHLPQPRLRGAARGQPRADRRPARRDRPAGEPARLLGAGRPSVRAGHAQHRARGCSRTRSSRSARPSS